MDLYDIYFLCSSTPWVAVIHLYVLFMIIEIYSYCKKETSDSLFDICTMSFDGFKGKAICASLVSILFIISVLFGSNQFVMLFDDDDIRYMPKGQYCYEVLATNEKGKTYTLPASISKVNKLEYEVDYIYFKNGGYLYFEDGEYFEFGDEVNLIDQRERFWDIELTNNKTWHEKVDETDPSRPSKLIFPFAEAAIIAFATILYIKELRKRKYYS